MLKIKQLIVFVLALLTIEIQDSRADPFFVAFTCIALADFLRSQGTRNGDINDVRFKEGEAAFIERQCKSRFPPDLENCRRCLSVDPPNSVNCMAAAAQCTHFAGLPICTYF